VLRPVAKSWIYAGFHTTGPATGSNNKQPTHNHPMLFVVVLDQPHQSPAEKVGHALFAYSRWPVTVTPGNLIISPVTSPSKDFH